MGRLSATERHKLRIYRTQAYHRQNGLCHWCKRYVEKEHATADHLSEVRHGGATNQDNIVMACARCNNDRSNKQYQHDHVRVWLRVKLSKNGVYIP